MLSLTHNALLHNDQWDAETSSARRGELLKYLQKTTINKKGDTKICAPFICSIAKYYLVCDAGVSVTSPKIIRFLTGVLALEVTTMVLLNGDATAAL